MKRSCRYLSGEPTNSPFICLGILTDLKILFYGFDFLKRWMEKLAIHYMKRAYFKIADVNDYESVKKSVMEADIAWERYDLIDNNGNMDTLSANFNEMERGIAEL